MRETQKNAQLQYNAVNTRTGVGRTPRGSMKEGHLALPGCVFMEGFQEEEQVMAGDGKLHLERSAEIGQVTSLVWGHF